MPLTKLQVDPLFSDRAYRAIREAILSLELKPEDYISWQELAEQLGVSQTPIRVGMLRPEQHGFASVVPHKGSCSVNISPQDIKKILGRKLRMISYYLCSRRVHQECSAANSSSLKAVGTF